MNLRVLFHTAAREHKSYDRTIGYEFVRWFRNALVRSVRLLFSICTVGSSFGSTHGGSGWKRVGTLRNCRRELSFSGCVKHAVRNSRSWRMLKLVLASFRFQGRPELRLPHYDLSGEITAVLL